MKIKLIIIICLSAMVLTGCGTIDQNNQEPATEPTPIEKVEPTATPTPEPTNTPTPEPTLEPTPAPTPTPEPTPTLAPTPTPRPAEAKTEDYSDWVLYDTDNLGLLLQNIASGYVIYDGENYWCSPEYYKMIENAEIVYEHDIAEDYDYEYDYSVLGQDDAAAIAQRDYLNGLNDDVEYEVIDEPEDDYDEETLAERIKDMVENNKATSGDD